MCGIAGEIRFDAQQASPKRTEAMLAVLAPRGPNGTGVFARDGVCFGHRRLKIIDLSDQAAQPMVDSHLGLHLVFNGCIYNYAELRGKLENLGYSFFSQGDTEVILKAYHAWGKACVTHFQGMFAFAIWDSASKRTFLARDRLGIKPLYYTLNTLSTVALSTTTQNTARQNTVQNVRSLCFASSLPALLQTGDVDTSIDPVALNYYMSFHAVVPAPHTILRGVKKLPPASTLLIDAAGNMQEETYWRLDFSRSPEDERRTEEDWVDAVQEALTLAVKRRLIADVPVGVLLSGGLDSSLLVGLLSELGQKDLQTFSVGFEDVAEEAGNEFRYSDIIANRFCTNHHKIYVKHDELQDNLSACVAAMSEPMVSHDTIGFYLLSRAVSQQVKVVQSGQGADEVFAGYHWYPPLMSVTKQEAVSAYAEVFFDRDFAEYQRCVNPRFVEEDYALRFVNAHFAQPNITDSVDRALRLDTQVMLVDDPVKRVDNMTMAWGLEARVPFLDHELVELAARIPAQYKVKDGGKSILKTVGRRLIPHEVIDRPKGYFPVPALKYLEGDYLTMAKSILSAPAAQSRGIFNADYVNQLFRSPREHLTPLRGSKLWQITVLEYWLQEQGL